MTCWCRTPQFGALKRIVSDIEESQQAAWAVFFKRLWVGRHASYACERIEALQKWNLHCMGPLISVSLRITTTHIIIILSNFSAPEVFVKTFSHWSEQPWSPPPPDSLVLLLVTLTQKTMIHSDARHESESETRRAPGTLLWKDVSRQQSSESNTSQGLFR